MQITELKTKHAEQLAAIRDKGNTARQMTRVELGTKVGELENALARAQELFAGKVANLKMENAQEVESLAQEVDKLAATRDREFADMKKAHEKAIGKLERALKQEKARRAREGEAAEAAAKTAAEEHKRALSVRNRPLNASRSRCMHYPAACPRPP